MATHDMNVANAGFPAVRADINSALQALASNSLSATAPTTTFGGQVWFDTTANLLKLRNKDNDAWVTLAYVDPTNDEWELRSAVIQAVDSAGVSIKTDDGVTRLSVSDSGQVSLQNYSFPTADGSAGQALATDGAGNLFFSDVGGDKIEEGNSRVEVVDTGLGYVQIVIDGTERARIDSSGNLKFNSGFGSVATAYGCRAWVNFNGDGIVAIRASKGVSSLVDNGTGQYTINFSTTMPDANYVVGCTAGGDTENETPYGMFFDVGGYGNNTAMATTSVKVFANTYTGGAFDPEHCLVTIHR